MSFEKICSARIIGAILTCAAVFGLSSGCAWQTTPPETASRQHQLLDSDWRFHRGDAPTNEVIAAAYDDNPWQPINLPHDYVLDGTYNRTENRSEGYLPRSVAWYRKHLFIPASDQGKVLQLEFGGVFRDSQVWLNGHFLGEHLSGYTTFYYDLSQAAHYGGDNVITVRVDPRGYEGWWYEGGGIYRHVYLNVLAPLHVPMWGIYVQSDVTNDQNGGEAPVTVQTTVENAGTTPVNYRVVSEIISPAGRPVKTIETTQLMAPGQRSDLLQHTVVPRPRLWSLETPTLYQLRTTLWQDGRAVDATTTPFGIRTLRFDADQGFFLNGKHVEIQGVANHQDFPAVGIAVPDSVEAWRVKQLKQMGGNAWRTAHNPPNQEVLDACDRQGVLVMDENRHLGDSYNHHSPAGTTSTNFSDLATMIQRDRNHPSIIMWSMCNEETLQGTPEGARIFSKMMNVVHQYDRTRPITSAMNAGWLKPGGDAKVEDIIGVNYAYTTYNAIRKANPDKMLFGSETANNKTTRGEYAYDRTNGWVSSYNLTDPAWMPVASRPYFAGSFTWTGFDYKGEPNPDGWPDVSNNTGIMDTCGFPKDKYYYLESWWSDKPMVHLMPANWNWPGKEGQKIRVIAFSNARHVELFLNGKSLGIQTMPRNSHLEWQVPYQPGQLLAKGYNDNNQLVATDQVETVGAPASLRLSPDRETLQADGRDALVIPVSILDAQGRLVPMANNRVYFHLTGGGKILGVGNGNPSDHDPDRARQRNAFNGHCITIIQSDAHPETLELTATSPGLAPAHLTFTVQ
jgi:beta-galactosidase